MLSEEALAALADDDFAPVSLRFATAYGVSPRLRVDLVLNNLVGWAFTTGKVKIMSDGTPWRPLIHIEDMARAMLAVLTADRDTVSGQAFNAGRSEENYQVRDLAEIVEETVGDCEIEYAGSGDPDPRSYRVDFTRFHEAFPAGLQWTARGRARAPRCLSRDRPHARGVRGRPVHPAEAPAPAARPRRPRSRASLASRPAYASAA